MSDYPNFTNAVSFTGVGFKRSHFDAIMKAPEAIGWVEIHAENYMVDGGPSIAMLRALRETMPVSCHGVGLSIGGEKPLDKEHLARLKKLTGWLDPFVFSEHLAWSSHDTGYLNDLLPLPYTEKTLQQVCAHIDQVQHELGRQMMLENPSTYVAFEQSEMAEVDFIREIAARTGCGLLLDVNNVFISATNQNYSPEDYLDMFPVEHVGEIHLGGHEADEDEEGATLLIDSHSRPVVDPVWQLYRRLIGKTGPKPTLIEWDNDVPDWPTLRAEAAAAAQIIDDIRQAA